MNNVARDFLSRISQEEFWKYLEVKACLLKDSKDKIWKVAFIEIQLLKESKVFEDKLPHSKNLILIHKILSIGSLKELVEQACEGKQIKIGTQSASLEWIREKPRYDFKMRAYVKQSFHIDEACHIIFKSGEYTNEIDRIIRQLEPLVWTKDRTFRDLKDALNLLLDIEFGKPAYMPFVRIFAPIYVKIEESKAKIVNTDKRQLEVLLSSAAETNLSKVKLLVSGENENNKPTELQKSITTFKRKDNGELMDPIVIPVDEETRYVKLSLYYADDLLEDYYLRIPKQVVRSIFETVGTDAVAVTKDKIYQYKEKIKAKYIEARNENNNTDTKGKALEEVITKILELVPDLEIIETRVTNGIQEIDIMVRNYNKTKVWADFESVFFVECKNWFKGNRPGAATIGEFNRKLENKKLRTGIFVAPNGITEGTGNDKVYGALGQLNLYLHDGIKIVVLEDEDIQAILNCRDVTEQVNEKFLYLYKS